MKILIANVWNDESTAVTVDNAVELEHPPAEVRFLTKVTYKVRVGIGLTKTVLHLILCLIGTGAGPTLSNEDYFKPQLKYRIRRLGSQQLTRQQKRSLELMVLILFVAQMRDLQAPIWFRIVQNLAVNILLRSTYIDRAFGIYPLLSER